MSITPTSCISCGTMFVKSASQQMRRYCWTCSERADLRRKKVAPRAHDKASIGKQVGAAKSLAAARTIAAIRPEPDLHWQVRVSVPFSYAASKNHIYSLRARGHVHLRKESANLKALIAAKVRDAVVDLPVVHNKVWIDILVQKSNHKGDAINVVDLVCDGIKKALPVDDRWYSIRSLDWEIVRGGGHIFISVGQENVGHAQVCSYCGQIRPLSMFSRSRHNHLGVGRECLTCKSEVRAARKRARVIDQVNEGKQALVRVEAEKARAV